MAQHPRTNQGLKRLVKQCRAVFECAENKNYYDDDDYQAAERKFVKVCLLDEKMLDK